MRLLSDYLGNKQRRKMQKVLEEEKGKKMPITLKVTLESKDKAPKLEEGRILFG
jgi:hypothetical protein